MNQLQQWVNESIAAADDLWRECDQRAVQWDDLPPRAVVCELGGYKGIWALRMARLYQPQLHIFEPQIWCCAVLTSLLAAYDAHIYPYGLGVEEAVEKLYHHGTDACSFIPSLPYTVNEKPWGWLREIGHTFEKLGLNHVDLMLMNIEGYENELLPHMLNKGILPQRLMLQAHGSQAQFGAIHRLIERDYIPRWSFGPTLSAWDLRHA